MTPTELRRTLVARSSAVRAASEIRRDLAVKAITDVATELARRGMVVEAWLIGSAAWGGFGLRSDVDVVVRGLAVSERAMAENAFSERVGAGVGVDLLRWEELPEGFCERVLGEGVRLA